jgi:hypothetical protein
MEPDSITRWRTDLLPGPMKSCLPAAASRKNRLGSTRHAHAALAHGRDDAIERTLRLSPFDPISYGPWLSITLGRFLCGEYEAAAEAARKVFQGNPFWRLAHVLLLATHAKLGRLEAAKSAAARVLELQPDYNINGFCASFDIHPSLATALS